MANIHPTDEIVSAVNPWPQVLPPQLRLDTVTHNKVDTAMPLRTCSLDAQGCFYSNWVAPLNSRVVLPYGFTRAPLEVFTRMKTR